MVCNVDELMSFDKSPHLANAVLREIFNSNTDTSTTSTYSKSTGLSVEKVESGSTFTSFSGVIWQSAALAN